MTTGSLFDNGIPFGAQYYRAPTPDAAEWEGDLDRFRAAGFNTLKFWVQWGWNEPEPGRFDFSDIERLMELSAARGLQVVLNTLFDPAPGWLWRQDFDCRMRRATGAPVQPQATACRQIGGTPGPCYNHPEARALRLRFLEATVERLAGHPALYLWDTWNEPEWTVAVHREPRPDQLVCYCEFCRAGFVEWLRNRHGTIEALNRVWGRRYRDFDEVDLPLNGSCFGDMLDWRRFAAETLTREQRERVEIVRRLDPATPVGCHTVPMPEFNPVTCCADDWALAEPGDWVGNSLGSKRLAADLIRSAGGGKPTLNAEIHAIVGTTLSRPRPLSLADCKRILFRPLAHGVRGFLFWQYRPELLGLEAPAWGLTRSDGRSTPWLEHFAALNARLQQEARFFVEADREGPEIGLVYSMENHVFAWCCEGDFRSHDTAMNGLYDALLRGGWRVRFIHPTQLASGRGLEGLKALCWPFPYVQDAATAAGLRRYVEGGGRLLGEAFFGHYNRDTNRHETRRPGLGLAELFGADEGIARPHAADVNFYLDAQQVQALGQGPLLRLDTALGGLPAGHAARGHLVEIPLEPRQDAELLARFEDGAPAICRHAVGRGQAILCGTILSAAAGWNPDTRDLIVALVETLAPTPRPLFRTEDGRSDTVRADLLRTRDGRAALCLENLSDQTRRGRPELPGLATPRLRRFLEGDTIEADQAIELPPAAVEFYFCED